MAVNRFLLGAIEASVNPGFVLIMSMWYTAPEQPLRLESYYCNDPLLPPHSLPLTQPNPISTSLTNCPLGTNGIATMFGGLIGYAIGHIKGGIARWMYVFIIFGSCSIAWGVVSLLLLPDLPSTAKFLTEHERTIAVERVAANRQGVKNKHFKKYQLVQTLRDPKTWILFVMAVGAQVPNSALTSVSPPLPKKVKSVERVR